MSVEDLWSHNLDKLLMDLQDLIESRCDRSASEGDAKAEELPTSKLLEGERGEQTPQFFDSEFHLENPGLRPDARHTLTGPC